MVKQVTITLRGKEYPVKKLSGMTAIGLIQRLYLQDDILDPAKMPSTAQGLKALIPDIPDTLISEDTINLQTEEFYEFVDDFREIYFLDNLEVARKLKDYKQEFEYVQGYSTFQAYRELRQKLRKEREGDWGWKTTRDVRLGVDDAPDDRTWFYFEDYYKEQIAIAESESKLDRVQELKSILSKAKISFEAYTRSKPTTSEDSSIESENELLRRELSELKNKQIAPVEV